MTIQKGKLEVTVIGRPNSKASRLSIFKSKGTLRLCGAIKHDFETAQAYRRSRKRFTRFSKTNVGINHR